MSERVDGPVRPPEPSEQIRFLQQLQRLLDEGSFTATYKYALLHAIADLCVTHGDDSGAPLTLDTRQIAERVIELYWRQTVPFPAGARTEVLTQHTGGRAAILRAVREARESYGERLTALQRRPEAWGGLAADVDRTVRRYPLRLLQTVGQEQVDFLYEIDARGREITLRPGVAYCFRAFHPLITDMVEGAWSHFVRRQNQDVLGTATDLRSFLFGSERMALERLRPVLREVQGDTCLYCLERLADRKLAVDHFIPWRRYPTDLGHNFVLAHARCNGAKADRLAAEGHLARWRDRNVRHGPAIEEQLRPLGVRSDLDSTWQVTRWAYGQVERARGQVWVEGQRLRPLEEGWERVLAVG